MGEAKRRGTFEERKAQAIARRAALTEKTAVDPKFRLPHGRRHFRSLTPLALSVAMASLTDSRGWRP